MISIIENTLRDGSYAVDFQISKEQTSEVTQGLSQCGFEMIEVGHGLGLGEHRPPHHQIDHALHRSHQRIHQTAIDARYN